MAYAHLGEHAHYRTNPLREDHQKMIVVERSTRVARMIPWSFKCYVVEKQGQALNVCPRRHLKMNCVFQRGVGKLRMVGTNELIGCIAREGEAHTFVVNGITVMKMIIGTGGGRQSSDHNGYDTYALTLDGQPYDMVLPQDTHCEYRLKYDIINTARMGVASHKNFRLRADSSAQSALECLKVSRKKLLLAVTPPLNIILAAVIGIIRFRKSMVDLP